MQPLSPEQYRVLSVAAGPGIALANDADDFILHDLAQVGFIRGSLCMWLNVAAILWQVTEAGHRAMRIHRVCGLAT